MTTPAININRAENRVDTYVRTRNLNTGYESTYSTSGHLGYYIRSRPASVSNPWTSLPKWRNPSPWSHSSVKVVVSKSDITAESKNLKQWSGGGHLWSGLATQIALANVVGAELPQLRERVVTKALNKLRQGDLDLGVALAELNQTASLVVNAMNSIRRQVLRFRKKHDRDIIDREYARRRRDLKKRGYSTEYIDAEMKRRKLTRKRNVWNDIKNNCYRCKGAEKWLEMVYGWTPLLSDVKAAIDDLGREWFDEGVNISVKSRQTDITDKSFEFMPSLAGLAGVDAGPATIKVETYHKAFASLWFRVVNAQGAVIGSLGLNNPALIVWEKVKYSFVVDWFLPIGPWLETFGADYGFEYLSGTVSYKREADGFASKKAKFTPKPGWTVSGSGPSANVNAEFFTRTVLRNRPIPGIAFKNPFTGAKRVVTALALLQQAFR